MTLRRHPPPVLQPVTLREASAFVSRHHRHHKAPRGGKFAIGLSAGTEVVGCAIVGRPVARHLDNGWTAEVLRVCVLDNVPNGCSMLYGACWRAARAMGYRRLVTYILGDETGTSVKAAGWRCIGEAGGGSWSRSSRPRVDQHPLQRKIRWEVEC